MPKSWQLINKVKQISPAFFKLSEDEKKLHIYKLLIKITAITGWESPDAEIMDIFIDQLLLKMDESYQFLNMDEIEYAFRNYKVEDYGKKLNLNIFDSVIEKYLADRKEVDAYQPEPIMLHNQVEQTNEELENELLEYSQRDYTGKKLYLLPLFLFDNLVKLGRLDLSEHAKVIKFREAIQYHEEHLRLKADSFDHESIKEYQTFLRLKQNHFENIDNKLTLILDSLHKKLYVVDYFTKIKEEGTGHIQ